MFARENPNSFAEPALASQLALASVVYLMTGKRSYSSLIQSDTLVPAVPISDDQRDLALQCAVGWAARAADAFKRLAGPISKRVHGAEPPALAVLAVLSCCVTAVAVLDPPESAYDEPLVLATLPSLGLVLELLAALPLSPLLASAAAVLRISCGLNVPRPSDSVRQVAAVTVAFLQAVCGRADSEDAMDVDGPTLPTAWDHVPGRAIGPGDDRQTLWGGMLVTGVDIKME